MHISCQVYKRAGDFLKFLRCPLGGESISGTATRNPFRAFGNPGIEPVRYGNSHIVTVLPYTAAYISASHQVCLLDISAGIPFLTFLLVFLSYQSPKNKGRACLTNPSKSSRAPRQLFICSFIFICTLNDSLHTSCWRSTQERSV